MNNNYINKKGYVLRKNILNNEQLNKIRNDLNVKPITHGDFGTKEESFKIYMENKNKIYVPKFYGIENFGYPEINNILPGKDIDINFSLSLTTISTLSHSVRNL